MSTSSLIFHVWLSAARIAEMAGFGCFDGYKSRSRVSGGSHPDPPEKYACTFSTCVRQYNYLIARNSCILIALISDGNSEIGAHVQSEIGNLICLRHLL